MYLEEEGCNENRIVKEYGTVHKLHRLVTTQTTRSDTGTPDRPSRAEDAADLTPPHPPSRDPELRPVSGTLGPFRHLSLSLSVLFRLYSRVSYCSRRHINNGIVNKGEVFIRGGYARDDDTDDSSTRDINATQNVLHYGSGSSGTSPYVGYQYRPMRLDNTRHSEESII
ncbi:hypothetical protein J6590_002765 [Homalodisca vitripennis]|nr:hypothetical protein J6590_002765 [Homalodisca vitripennis]